jgi:septum formation protein
MKKLMLASASPRRKQLLKELGVRFSVISGSFDEPPHSKCEAPSVYVRKNAEGKARSAVHTDKNALIIGADTIVVYRGRLLGKPGSLKDSFDYLHLLNGRTHAVYTGLCVFDASDGSSLSDYEKTQVTFRKLTEAEIGAYLGRINPMDKAGAYAIQGEGALIVDSIVGCYYNVMGFPIAKLEQMLLKKGVSLFEYMKKHRGSRDSE